MDDPLVYARAIHFAATIVAAGAVYFRVFIAAPVFAAKGEVLAHFAENIRRQCYWQLWIGFVLAVLSGVLWLLLLAGTLYEAPLSELWSNGGLWTVATETRFGQVSLARLTLAIVLAAMSVGWPALTPRAAGFVQAALATALLVAPAWTGHAGATPGLAGAWPLAADALHLLAAGIWLGALPLLAMLLAATCSAEIRNTGELVVAVVRRFSLFGMASVVALLATGIINSWYEVGAWGDLLDTAYGRLVLVKAALFAAMVAVATVNRFHHTPRLVTTGLVGRAAKRRLQRNCWIETVLGFAAVSVAGVLGAMAPAIHTSHEHEHGIHTSHEHEHGADHAVYQEVPAGAAFVHIHSDEGMAEVTITPGRVGMSRATIYLWDENSDALDARDVTLALTPPAAGSTPVTRSAARSPQGGWNVENIALRTRKLDGDRRRRNRIRPAPQCGGADRHRAGAIARIRSIGVSAGGASRAADAPDAPSRNRRIKAARKGRRRGRGSRLQSIVVGPKTGPGEGVNLCFLRV